MAKTSKTTTAPAAYKPTGKRALVVKMAMRKNGASVSELTAATGWHGTPWKWNFQNPKKTGFADRMGLKFEVWNVDGEIRYYLTKQAAAA